MNTNRSMRVAAWVLPILLAGCTSLSPPASPAERDSRRIEARAAVDRVLDALYAEQPQARQAVQQSIGYAVFHDFGMKVLVAGGGTGKGIAVDNRDGREVYMRMAEIQAGLGFGAKSYDLVWIFASASAFDGFVNQGFEFGGQATVAAKAGAVGGAMAGAIQVAPDVWVYQMTESGLAAELTVRGTRYYRDQALD